MNEKRFRRVLVSAICLVLCSVMLVHASFVAFADETKPEEKKPAAVNSSEEEYRNQISNLQDEQIKIQEEMKTLVKEIRQL